MATIPSLVIEQKNKHPNAISLRYKHLGIWKAYSWTDYLDEISVLAGAYQARSVGKGTVVAIYGNSIPKLVFTIAAVQSLGGIIVPIHPEATATELTKILNDASAEILVAEDQQQVDTFHVAEADCKIKDVIYLNGRGLTNYKNANLYSFDEIAKKAKPVNIELESKQLNDNDLAFYMYDEFEDAMYSISHGAITNNSKKIVALNSLTVKDSIVSYLSLSIPTNLLFTYVTSLVSGMSLNLPESNQTIEKDLQEIGPTILYAPSFVFKHIISSISYRIEAATQANYERYNSHYDSLMKIYDKEIQGKSSLFDKVVKAYIMLVTFAPAKNVFGLSKIKHAFVSDGVLSKVTFDFFHAIGVEIQHSFGQTSSCGCISVQPDHSVSSENVGAAMTGTEIKINDKSEVLFKTDCLATPLTGGSNGGSGWINSGYIGKVKDSGNLMIRGRSDDIIRLKSGKEFSPESIENLISCSPFVKSSMIIGTNQDSVSVLVVIDPNAVNSWADRKNLRYTGYTELASKVEVRDLIKEHITCLNESLEDALKIKRFIVLHRTLIMAEGEVSKTMEVKRKTITANLNDVIVAIESNKEKFKVNDIDSLTYELNVHKI